MRRKRAAVSLCLVVVVWWSVGVTQRVSCCSPGLFHDSWLLTQVPHLLLVAETSGAASFCFSLFLNSLKCIYGEAKKKLCKYAIYRNKKTHGHFMIKDKSWKGFFDVCYEQKNSTTKLSYFYSKIYINSTIWAILKSHQVWHIYGERKDKTS